MKDNLQVKDIPTSLLYAILATTDDEFPLHHGINFAKIKRKLHNYFRFGGTLAGGSSITQQLAKNFYTGGERTLKRKLIELLYAFKLENTYSKEDLFTLYINIAQTGPNIYGFKEASLNFFKKEPRYLTYMESVFLATNLPAPDQYPLWLTKQQQDQKAGERLSQIDFRTRYLQARYAAEEHDAQNLNIFSVLRNRTAKFEPISYKDIKDNVIRFVMRYQTSDMLSLSIPLNYEDFYNHNFSTSETNK